MASDRLFSKLRYDIIEKILCCLNLRERATASLVSKNWHHMITSLYDRKFIHKNPAKIYCGCCNCYPSFSLEFCEKCSNHRTVIKVAPDKSTLTEIFLSVPISSAFLNFSPAVFDSRLLTVLHLKFCEINGNDIKSFPCLKEIYFDQVSISPRTFFNFINKCPSIVELTLIDCSSLNSVSVPDMNQLKKVHVCCVGTYIQTIEIKARNLLEFCLLNSPPELEVDLCACTKLQVLNLNCANIPRGFPQEVCSTFPRLKSLSLPLCEGLKKIKITSPELESLSLIDTTESKEVIFHLGNILRSNIEPLCIKHITLEILTSRVSRYESLIDELFTYFHPRTLLVRVDSDAQKYNNFIQVLLDELKDWERKLESGKRCKYSNNISWRYLLKGFKILESSARQLSLEFQW